MSEDDNHKMKNLSSSDDKKKKRRKKRKKRKKLCASHTPPQHPALVETNPAVKPPEALQVTPVPRGQPSKRRVTCKKGKDLPREPQLPLALDSNPKEPTLALALTPMPTPTPSPQPLDVQVRECLRWEGVLLDPLAEEERLEAYRANRRRRYVAQRDTLLASALVQTPPRRTPRRL